MEYIARILRFLGDKTRLRIMVLLSHHPLNVSELTMILGLAQSGVSRHLGHLRKLGLLQEQKVGVWSYYQLSAPEARNPKLELLWGYLHQQLAAFNDPFNDRVRLHEVLHEREIGGPGLNERLLEPGQTWYAWSRLLGMIFQHLSLGNQEQSQLLPDGLSVVDLGCGDGSLTVEMARFAVRVIGVDINPEVLVSARHRIDRLGLKNVSLMVEDVSQLPIDSDSIDIAFFSQSHHHLTDPSSGFLEATKILRPGGTVAIMELASHDQEWVKEKLNHKWLGFEKDRLLSMMHEAGFSNLKEETQPHARGELFRVILLMGTK